MKRIVLLVTVVFDMMQVAEQNASVPENA